MSEVPLYITGLPRSDGGPPPICSPPNKTNHKTNSHAVVVEGGGGSLRARYPCRYLKMHGAAATVGSPSDAMGADSGKGRAFLVVLNNRKGILDHRKGKESGRFRCVV